jgi:S-formylglutathione hydrolase FrmB
MPTRAHRGRSLALLVVAASLGGCGKGLADHPRLTVNVELRDVTFHSKSLEREVSYRVILPASLRPGQKLQVVYLLHGAGGGFRDWSNHSDVARFAGQGLLLVMPNGASSYYANAVSPSWDRYEDYVVGDLIADVEARFPVAAGRGHRAIVGVSMGGFGAVNLALRHPDLFAFAGALSPAIDVPRRAFSFRRLGQSIHYRAIFGASDSSSRRDSDPFLRVRTASPEAMPYLFLACGEQEGLLPANREFATRLAERHLRHELHTSRGGHDWRQWNSWLPALFESLVMHLDRASGDP